MRAVVSVGADEKRTCGKQIPWDSRASLSDADIVIFEPRLNLAPTGHLKDGRPSFSESTAVKLMDQLRHWRLELGNAFENGKTIVVWLVREDLFYVRDPRGTSEGLSTYFQVPAKLALREAQGSIMQLSKHASSIRDYWEQFGDLSVYQVYLPYFQGEPVILTKGEERVVGGMIRNESGGTLLLLPPICAQNEVPENINQRLLLKVVEIDRALSETGDDAPPPEWSLDPTYELSGEAELLCEVEEVQTQIEALTDQKDKFLGEHRDLTLFRALLYEKGKALERAVAKACEVLGFEVDRYEDDESEFDLVLEGPEGRLLGEVEGKDNSAIALGKLRQLTTNVLEDYEKAERAEPPKGVLFGNAFRLSPLEERQGFFTEHCRKAADRFDFALVRTCLLYTSPSPRDGLLSRMPSSA